MMKIPNRQQKRQTESEEECYVGNDVLACYPTSKTAFVQDRWGRLIWNRNYPEFTNNGGYLDIYLFHEDNDKLLRSWKNVENAQGRLSFSPKDDWWQGRLQADNFNGTDIEWPFYFVITYAGRGLQGGVQRLATWNAVQTALPVQVAQARASASAASLAAAVAAAAATRTQSAPVSAATPAPYAQDVAQASDLAASLTAALEASLNAESYTGTQAVLATATATFPDGFVATATATVQPNVNFPGGPETNGHNLPDWAIALIVILGFLTLVGLVTAWYFCIAAVRRKRNGGERAQDSYDDMSNAGSNAPMIVRNIGDEKRQEERQWDQSYQEGIASPMSPASPTERFALFPSLGAGSSGNAPRARATSRGTLSGGPEETSEGLSVNEAWRLANAFRAALRRPKFTPRASLMEHSSGSDSLGLQHQQQLQQQQQQQQSTTNRSSGLLGKSSVHPSTHSHSAGPARDEAEDEGSRDHSEYDAVEALLRQELADEGRVLRTVDERRTPELHSPSSPQPPPASPPPFVKGDIA